MSQSNLIELTYFDPKACVRLTTYADTIITDKGKLGSTITAIRFGGYPEMVRAMSDAIYGGAAIAAAQKDEIYDLESIPKAYRRELSHDGLYATATLMIDDEALSADPLEEDDGADQAQSSVGNRSWPKEPKSPKSRRCYIFCPAGDRDRLFEELDRKTAAPLIPAFRDYVLDELIARNILRQMDDAVGQCFMRARHTVGPGPERSKGYFLLLRRLLGMGMDPNQKTSYGVTAWQHALDQYEQFTHRSYPSYNVETAKEENRRLREMLKAVLDELLKHGADIHDFRLPNEEGLSHVSVILRNMEEGRELLDGMRGLDPDSDMFKPHTEIYRGKERLVQPYYTVEDYRQQYEIKWRELEPILRDYYKK